MSTLDDLRSTLDRHADGLDDTERFVRPIAVRARIRTVRRRRTGLVAVAAAVVVLATAATVGQLRSPDRPQPAEQVVGVDVPGSIEVLGFPYALEQTNELSDGTAVRIRSTSTDQAVTLAASGLGSGSATLYQDDEAVARVRSGEPLAVPLPIYDASSTFRVRLDGAPTGARAGLAVYRSTGALADGVSDGTSVFRDTVAGNRLITAAYAAPGATSVTVHATGRLDRMQFASRCSDSEKGLWLNLSVDGDGAMSSTQCSDGGTDNTPWASLASRATGRHTVIAYATRGENGPRVAVSELGVGVYARGRTVPVMDSDIQTSTEFAGRTWRLTRVLRERDATIDTADGDALLGFAASGGTSWVSWRGDLDNGRTSGISGGGSTVGPVLLAGDRYDLRLRSEGAGASGVLLVYRPE